MKQKRIDQVAEKIEAGTYTKDAIAADLGTTPHNVASQLTYLRWRGKFIWIDPDTKVLSFVTEDEYNAKMAALPPKKSRASAKSPEEIAAAAAIRLARLVKQAEGIKEKTDAEDAAFQVMKDSGEPIDRPVELKHNIMQAKMTILASEIELLEIAGHTPDFEGLEATKAKRASGKRPLEDLDAEPKAEAPAKPAKKKKAFK